MSADVFHLHTWLWLPAPRERVFAFFSDADNLERITPAFLNFHVRTPAPIAMASGTRIDYRLHLHGIPLRWRSEISDWDPPSAFRDTQLRGPYKQWIHTHTFEEQNNGTMVRDDVRYRLPGPAITARLVNRLMVSRDTKKIFEFRHQALCEIFATHAPASVGPVVIDIDTP